MVTHHETAPSHALPGRPSPWITRHAHLVAAAGQVLDLAAGSGRHTRYFNALGHPVLAIDRDITGLADLRSTPGIEIIALDLEIGDAWPLPDRHFAAIIVTNYLHRALLPHLGGALQPGGMLIYETFALGNERFGRPSNPDFLLQPGELLEVARAANLTVLAYEHGEVSQPKPAVIQHIVARRDATSIT